MPTTGDSMELTAKEITIKGPGFSDSLTLEQMDRLKDLASQIEKETGCKVLITNFRFEDPLNQKAKEI
jgi:maltose-binding protein MalE